MSEGNISALVDELIREYKSKPIHLLSVNNEMAEEKYIATMRSWYIRTINDIVAWTGKKNPIDIKILEIGSFLGLVSIALARLGYCVVATDIPEFMDNQNLQTKFKQNNVNFFSTDLSNLPVLCNDQEYDVVIMCEVLEHLNFNPLPVIQEINRITKISGVFYLSLPNLASLKNRVQLVQGKSIHNPIEYFIWQLDPLSTMKIGIHWREYTLQEVNEILSMMNFFVERQYYFDWFDKDSFFQRTSLLQMVRYPLKKFLYYFFPRVKETLIVLARKTANCESQWLR